MIWYVNWELSALCLIKYITKSVLLLGVTSILNMHC